MAPNPVSLSVSNLPGDATAVFSADVINEGETSTLTVNTNTTVAGTYQLSIDWIEV